uniref:CSON000939 protein n=1 Tax=Culicoides sonorensis TaxID=179676 RepID=A0A336MG47_CULSO
MTSNKGLILEDDQKFKLMKFKRAVHDITQPDHDEYFLVRWLRARKWNPEAAEKMFRDSMKWRERMEADVVEKWQAPEILPKYCTHGLTGFDKGGSPVIVVPFAGMDFYGLLHVVSRSDFVRFILQLLEQYMKIAKKQSDEHGPDARQFTVIFDMEGFYLKQFAWRPAAEVVISLIKMYEANYPEILKCCYIINAPKVFAFAFNIVKKFFDEYTLSKIQIYRADRNKWLPVLLEKVDKSQLPKYLGGELTDDDGNPRCEKIICFGGRVPKELYVTQDDGFISNNNETVYEEAIIKKGGQLKLQFECTEPGCYLKWEFRTLNDDIKFGVRSINHKTEEVTTEFPLRRCASHQGNEIGFIKCQPNCLYKVLFDNTYSYFKSKKIQYSVVMTDSVVDLDVEPEDLTGLDALESPEEENSLTNLD